jgi:PA14 domain/FG-GAP-like repeat
MEPSLITPDSLGFSQVSSTGDMNLLTVSSTIGTTPINAASSSQAIGEPTSLSTPSLPIPPAIGTGTGLLGQYYNGLNFDNLALTRIDPTIDFNWTLGSPGSAIGTDRFSVRWTGKIQPLYSEAYTLYVRSDDGIRLWINGKLIIDDWTLHGLLEQKNTITLAADQIYDIKLEYYENTGGAASRLSWSSASQTKEVIPQSQLYGPNLELPTANLIPLTSTVTNGSTNYRFSVIYTDSIGLKRDTIDNQDILVSGPNNFKQFAQLISVSSDQDSKTLIATYNITAPGGVWNASVFGNFDIILQANQVSDTDNNFIDSYVLGTFDVDFVPPTAKLATTEPVIKGSSRYNFSVIYTDNLLVYPDSLDSQDLLVTGPNNFRQFAKIVSFSPLKNSNLVTGIYSLEAPNGIWDTRSSGSYTVELQQYQVRDTHGYYIPKTTLGTITIDLTPPTAALATPTAITSGNPNYQFDVVYNDSTAVKRSSIDGQDILVTGPNNFSQFATLSSVSTDKDGSPLTATYNIVAPDGIWDSADTGAYTITLQPNQISDLDGNFIATTLLKTLAVDLTPPTAILTAPIVLGGQLNSTFTVVYSDTTAVKRSTIDGQDILVTGPNNLSQFATLISVSSTQDGSPLTATYSLAAPGGVWDSADTGTYTITLQPNQIIDLDGNFITTTVLGTVAVDLTPPTAILTAPIVLGGQLNSTFTVVYSDTTAVKRSTIDGQDILVTGPNKFSQFATLISVSNDLDGSPLTATYSITAPGGIWDSADTGAYTITLQPNQITDLNGNVSLTSLLGTVAVDLTPPTATLTASNIAIGGQKASTITVVYSDETAIQRSSIDGKDILVTGPNDFSQLASLISVSKPQDGSPLTATYSITAPGGIWDATDAGTYTITLQPNQVSDPNGNFLAAGRLGTFWADQSIYTSDFDGDGKLDILLRDLNSQKILVWLINGITLTSQAFLPDAPTNYTIVDTSDFNGDGNADIRWRNGTNEAVVVWLMDGTVVKSQVSLPQILTTSPIEPIVIIEPIALIEPIIPIEPIAELAIDDLI